MIMSETKSKRMFIIMYILIISTLLIMSSCGSTKQCNKTNFKHDMSQWYYQPHIECENCDEID